MAKRIFFSLLLCLVIINSSCSAFPSSSTSNDSPQATDEVAIGDWYSVYFSDPDSARVNTYRGGPDSALADAISKAHLSVDAAIYDLNLWSIRDALIAAHESGVKVRVVVESDNLDEVEIQDLSNAGIEILGDRRESLMHNKFVVIDGAEVWTGSMNFTTNGAYRNDNNLIRFRSTQLAENFTNEFEEMFVRDMFGDNVVVNTPHPVLSVGGTQIETYFSPDDHTLSRIVELIQSAEDSIYFMAYSFTSDDIAEAMLARAEKGVVVTGVFDEGQYYSNAGTEFDRLVEAGLDVRLDGNSHDMHHKVIIIDSAIVILGSYNFSRNAEEHNDENTLIIHNTNIAAQYMAEFQRVLAKAHEH
jgi:phosphatidylserine/phosphatidylglycerophosphate/cardiolipin synthase-like enzyme